jgi:hypothetical protein
MPCGSVPNIIPMGHHTDGKLLSHSVVLPDGTHRSDTNRPGLGRSAFFLLAAIAMAVGFLTLGTLTTPDPEAAPPPTSTTTTTTGPLETPIDLDDFTVDQIETGPQLDWQSVAVIEDAFPYEILEHDDQLYVVASSAGGSDVPPTGLRAWRSDDGIAWDSLGELFGQDHQISWLTSTDLGLIAVETNSANGNIQLWGSADGVSWEEAYPSIPAGDDGITSFEPSTVAATDRVVVVAGQTWLDGRKLAEQYLRDTTGSEVDLSDLSTEWDVTGEDLTLAMRGPLGFLAHRIPAADLGLSDEQMKEISGLANDPGSQTAIWVKGDDGDWVSAEVEGAFWLTSMTALPDGDLVAFGYGATASTWRSVDGVTWERYQIEGGHPYIAERWGDRLVGIGDTMSNQDILISEDGTSWEPVGLGELFPNGLDWYPSGFASSEKGIAVVSELWPSGQFPSPESGPSTMEKDGYTITLRNQTGNLTIESDDDVHSFAAWTGTQSDHIAVDLQGRTVTFHDRESGEAIVSLTFDELNDLERGAPIPRLADHAVFSFSPDGETWTVQGLDSEMGENGRVLAMDLTEERVVALVVRPEDWKGAIPAEGFEIWSAEVPDGATFSSGTSQ